SNNANASRNSTRPSRRFTRARFMALISRGSRNAVCGDPMRQGSRPYSTAVRSFVQPLAGNDSRQFARNDGLMLHKLFSALVGLLSDKTVDHKDREHKQSAARHERRGESTNASHQRYYGSHQNLPEVLGLSQKRVDGRSHIPTSLAVDPDGAQRAG